MNNKERLLTLIREHYAQEIAHADRMSGLYSRIAATRAHLKWRETFRLWDVVDLELANFDRHYAQFQSELEALYEVTSPSEFTEDEHQEMQTLLETGISLSKRMIEQLKQIREDALQ